MNHPTDSADRELRERLGALRTDLPDGEFKGSLHRRLVAAGPPVPPAPLRRLAELFRSGRVLWPLAGAAAGVAMFLALSSQSGPVGTPGGGGREPLATLVPVTRVAVVRLTLSADAPVDAAQIHVTLPPGLSFWADGRELAQRDFEWTQQLAAGDNEIPIAVRGQRPGHFRIGVDTRVAGQLIRDEILIEVTSG